MESVITMKSEGSITKVTRMSSRQKFNLLYCLPQKIWHMNLQCLSFNILMFKHHNVIWTKWNIYWTEMLIFIAFMYNWKYCTHISIVCVCGNLCVLPEILSVTPHTCMNGVTEAPHLFYWTYLNEIRVFEARYWFSIPYSVISTHMMQFMTKFSIFVASIHDFT